jgi:two-component system sensor histidine kinase CiaH
MFQRLHWRLTLLNAGVMLVVLGLLALPVFLFMDRLLLAQETSALQAQASSDEHELSERGGDQAGLAHGSYESGSFVLVWNDLDQPPVDPAQIPSSQLRPAAAAALSGHPSVSTVEVSGQPLLVDSRPVLRRDGATSALQVGVSLRPIKRLEQEVILILLAAVVLGVLLSLLAGWFLADRATRPIRDAFQRQREFSADASHELRTPLAVIDAGMQVLQRHPEQRIGENQEVVDSAAQEIGRMRRLLDALLTLARADSGELDLHLVETDVDGLVDRVVSQMRPLAAAHSSPLELRRGEAGTTWLDPDGVTQLIMILVGNAISHSPEGTEITVSSLRQGAGEILIEVADHGPGIPPEQRNRVFERFHRLEHTRTTAGAGLGLPIAAWLVRAHRGTIRLLDNHPGLLVRVSLPAGASRVADSEAAARAWWDPRRLRAALRS